MLACGRHTLKFCVKVFYVMDKVLKGELSCMRTGPVNIGLGLPQALTKIICMFVLLSASIYSKDLC